MNCEEAAEFVSALCDGERIPRTAAEHVGACEVCGTRLKEYVEMGAELRRVASLESMEPRQQIWAKQQRTKSSLWQKGWETMRIPRLAFVLLLIAVTVLGSGLVIVKARAHTEGPVLMLKVKPEDGQSMLCPLSTQDERSASCSSVLTLKSGLLANGFRIISKNGDRIELGMRAKFTAFPIGAGETVNVSTDDVRNFPESTYWFEPGEKLEIDVPGSGPLTVTGELKDHAPSIVTENNELDPAPDELRVFSPVLLRNKKVILDFEGFFGTASTKNYGIFIYAPNEGRYVLSLSPLKGAVQGHASTSRITFEVNGESYAFLTAAPVARGETVWVLHQPHYRPSQESPVNHDDQIMAGSIEVNSLLAKPSTD